MNFSVIIGLLASTLVVIIAIIIGGNPLSFFNVPSILIVVLGTLFSVLVRYKLKEMIQSFSVVKEVIRGTKEITSPDEIIIEMLDILKYIRKKGVVAVQNYEVNHAFLKLGITMISDGYKDQKIIDNLLSANKVKLLFLNKGSSVWGAIGDSAPAFGMIGTLVGLIQMLSNLSDPSSIGPAMSVAMLTTLYGALFANLIAIPLSEKIKQHANEIKEMNLLIIEGVKMITDGTSPLIFEDSLKHYKKEKMSI